MLVPCYAGHCQTVLFDFDLQSVILECIWYPSVAHAALKQIGIKSANRPKAMLFLEMDGTIDFDSYSLGK